MFPIQVCKGVYLRVRVREGGERGREAEREEERGRGGGREGLWVGLLRACVCALETGEGVGIGISMPLRRRILNGSELYDCTWTQKCVC